MVKDAETHAQFADRLRGSVAGSGMTAPELRVAAMIRAGGGPPMAEPYDALAGQIGEAAYLVDDGQVAAVKAALGTDKEAFEVILSASIGAGLLRWDSALRAIEGAADATS